jgi:hypothetical protein
MPNNHDYTIRMVCQLGGPKVKAMVDWLVSQCNKHEYLEMTYWVDNCWHIAVRDRRISQHPVYWLFGLSVDVVEDEVHWTNPFATGKRLAFVRSIRWRRLLKKKLGGTIELSRVCDDWCKTSGPHLLRKKTTVRST